MDDALGMHDDVNIIVVRAKEIVSFDYLKSLVHHRGTVHGDLCTHVPVWVRQRISYSHLQWYGGKNCVCISTVGKMQGVERHRANENA